MSTLAQLADLGTLKRYEPMMERGEFPDRNVFFAREAHNWSERTLISAPRDRSRNLSPFEQVDQLLHDFVIGRPMIYDQHRKMLDPFRLSVWELKTEDVRLIGWFPQKKNFVIVCGQMKKDLRQFSLYAPCICHTVWFRARLDLDEPKCVEGVRPSDVL